MQRLIKSNYNGGQKCWDLFSDISKSSEPSPSTLHIVEFWANWWNRNDCFYWPQHCCGGEGGGWEDDEMSPKPIKKLSLGAKSYVTILLGRAFSHSPWFFAVTSKKCQCKRA